MQSSKRNLSFAKGGAAYRIAAARDDYIFKIMEGI